MRESGISDSAGPLLHSVEKLWFVIADSELDFASVVAEAFDSQIGVSQFLGCWL